MIRHAAVAVAVLLVAAPASAHRCDRTDNDRAEASRAISAINARIDRMEQAIVEALRLQTGQLSGYQAQGTKALVQAIDAQTRLQAQTRREVEETRIMRAKRPAAAACSSVTGLRAGAATGRATTAAHRDAARRETGRIIVDRTVASTSVADNAARFDFLTERYCNAGRRGEDPAVCRGTADDHGADLNPANLFDRSTFSPADRDVVREFARNLTVPVVHDPLPLAAADTSQEKQRALLGRAADSRAALAADYLARVRAMREPGAALGEWAAAVAPDRDPSQPVSRHELLEIMASRRFDRPEYFVELQAMSEANLLREITTLLAVSLMLDWQRYRTDEHRGAMEAARLAATVETMRRLPGLANPAGAVN